MRAIASQITSLTIVYSTVYSGADQRKHQSSVSLAFVQGIHRGPVNSPHKVPVTRKILPFDDVFIMVSNLSSLAAPRVCCYNNLQYGQWWQSWHHENSRLSVQWIIDLYKSVRKCYHKCKLMLAPWHKIQHYADVSQEIRFPLMPHILLGTSFIESLPEIRPWINSYRQTFDIRRT